MTLEVARLTVRAAPLGGFGGFLFGFRSVVFGLRLALIDGLGSKFYLFRSLGGVLGDPIETRPKPPVRLFKNPAKPERGASSFFGAAVLSTDPGLGLEPVCPAGEALAGAVRVGFLVAEVEIFLLGIGPGIGYCSLLGLNRESVN